MSRIYILHVTLAGTHPLQSLLMFCFPGRVERLIRDAQGKQTEDSLRKLAREAAKIEVNAHHGLVGECH